MKSLDISAALRGNFLWMALWVVVVTHGPFWKKQRLTAG
jgi:hypothetical protein